VSQGLGRFKPYPEYKDSGVEWLGKIPKHWRVGRLRSVASVRLSNVDKKFTEGELPVRLCNYINVYYNERLTKTIDFMKASATPDQVKRFSLRRGDVLITKDSESWTDIAIPSVVLEDLPDVLCGYHLAHIRPMQDHLDGPFLARTCSAIGPRDQFQIAANGITRYGLTRDSIRAAVFALPPIAEQQGIANLLDRKTFKIDTLIAKKERLIELLQEKRSALITHAVTKGLNPAASMKDSGDEFLGATPSHWLCVPLSRVTLSRCDGPFGSGLKSEHYRSSGVRVVRLQNIGTGEFVDTDHAYIEETHARELGDHSVLADDVLVAGLGDDSHPVGRACVAPPGIHPAMVKADCFRFRVDSRLVFPHFVARQLTATAVIAAGSLATGATRARMNLTATSQWRLALPPINEQAVIAKFVDAADAQCSAILDVIKRGINHLNEYRTALVSAAVTGKIDLRTEVA